MIQPAKYSVRIFITFRAKILLIPLVTSNIINTLLILLKFYFNVAVIKNQNIIWPTL